MPRRLATLFLLCVLSLTSGCSAVRLKPQPAGNADPAFEQFLSGLSVGINRPDDKYEAYRAQRFMEQLCGLEIFAGVDFTNNFAETPDLVIASYEGNAGYPPFHEPYIMAFTLGIIPDFGSYEQSGEIRLENSGQSLPLTQLEYEHSHVFSWLWGPIFRIFSNWHATEQQAGLRNIYIEWLKQNETIIRNSVHTSLNATATGAGHKPQGEAKRLPLIEKGDCPLYSK